MSVFYQRKLPSTFWRQPSSRRKASRAFPRHRPDAREQCCAAAATEDCPFSCVRDRPDGKCKRCARRGPLDGRDVPDAPLPLAPIPVPVPASAPASSKDAGAGIIVRYRLVDPVAMFGVPAGDAAALWTFLHHRLRPPYTTVGNGDPVGVGAAARAAVPVTHALGASFPALVHWLPRRPDAVFAAAARARAFPSSVAPCAVLMGRGGPFPVGFLAPDDPAVASVPRTFAWLSAYAVDPDFEPYPLLPFAAPAATFAPLTMTMTDEDDVAAGASMVPYGPVPEGVDGFRLARLVTHAGTAGRVIVYAHEPSHAFALPPGRRNLPRYADVILRLFKLGADATAAAATNVDLRRDDLQRYLDATIASDPFCLTFNLTHSLGSLTPDWTRRLILIGQRKRGKKNRRCRRMSSRRCSRSHATIVLPSWYVAVTIPVSKLFVQSPRTRALQ
jgi:hypothetical protein